MGVRGKQEQVLFAALESWKEVQELTQLLVQLVVSGLSQHSLFATLAIKKLCSHSLTLPRATSFFDHLHNADAFHCNTIIRAYTRKPDFPAALCFYYHRMLARSVLPNQCTFPLLIKLCTDIGSLREGLKGMQLDSKDLVRSLIPSYIRDSSVAVIVYDVASRQTFLNTPKWIEEVCSERGSDVIVVLVGNKTLVDKWPFFRKIAVTLPGMKTLSRATWLMYT